MLRSLPKKTQVFLVPFSLLVVFTVVVFFSWHQLKQTKYQSRPLSSRLNELSQLSGTNKPFREIQSTDITYYEMNCQMFASDIQLRNIRFNNFIIRSYAPCFYYVNPEQTRIASINLPLVIEDTSTHVVIQMNSLPFSITNNLEDITNIRNLTESTFYDSSGNIAESILVRFFFSYQLFSKTDDESMINFLNPLLAQVDQTSLIQQLLTNNQISNNQQSVFLYQYAERELLK